MDVLERRIAAGSRTRIGSARLDRHRGAAGATNGAQPAIGRGNQFTAGSPGIIGAVGGAHQGATGGTGYPIINRNHGAGIRKDSSAH